MAGRRRVLPKTVLLAALAAATAVAVSPLTAIAVNKRVNNPSRDPAPNITQGDPHVAGTAARLLAVFEDSSGGGSRIGFARSTNAGTTWSDRGQIPRGMEDFLGDPRIVHNPLVGDWYVVTESCFPPANKCPPNVVTTSDFGTTWNTPVDIHTAISTKDQQFGTNPDIAVDSNPDSPFRGRVYVTWTNFHVAPAPTSSQLVVQWSDDRGKTWTPPVQVSDNPDTFAENSRVVVAPDGSISTIFMDYDPAIPRYNLVVDHSTDGGMTWGTDRIITTNLQSTGVLKNCGSAGTVAVLNGDIRSFARPDLAVSPTNGNLYVTWHAPKPGSNLPDVFFLRSTNGGQTWGSPIRLGDARDQFFPAVEVGPDGTVGLFWYDRRNDSANLKIDVYGAFSVHQGATFGPAVRVTNTSFKVPKLNPNYDTGRSTCDFHGGIDVWFPGSGAYVIWGDGRDAGPAGNNGVDPNIYFVHVPIPTTTTAAVARGATTVVVTGTVAPPPGGKVTATLYRKVAGKFVKVTAKSATVNTAGRYSVSFTRTAAGSCQVIVAYAGSTEYSGSSVTKTFSC